MKNIDKSNISKRTLDLRKGWKQIDKKDAENIINNRAKGNYWRFNEDKTRITILRDGKIANYRTNETEILFTENHESNGNIKQETKSEVLKDLFLSPDCKVGNTAEAYERARFSDKKVFWFISKGGGKAVIVLDFSQGKKPKRTVYPLDKYNLKIKVVKI